MIASALAVAFLVPAVQAGLCPKWGEPVQTGSLDPALLPEASGLAVSGKWPRLYHVNDSGGGPVFYVSDLSGNGLKRVQVEGFLAVDTEDLSLGPCGGKTCLFIGDTGDNFSHREDVSVALVVEEKDFGGRVQPLKVLTLRYPDKAHNAEGLAVHPNGDLFIVTKETAKKKTRPAKLFRLAKDKVMGDEEGTLTLEPWGEVDVQALNEGTDKWGKTVSSFDIAPDGKRFVLLTYRNALEFSLDLSAGPAPSRPEEGRDFARVPLKVLVQQESVAYLPDGRGLLYDTEFSPGKAEDQAAAELIRVPCAEDAF
ncbi:MAG: hypothetical protein HY748_01210 [Elusimicrobia bacterium]|nr:hypothetical protein [Elusimicrobiota bacterium]